MADNRKSAKNTIDGIEIDKTEHENNITVVLPVYRIGRITWPEEAAVAAVTFVRERIAAGGTDYHVVKMHHASFSPENINKADRYN